MEEKKLIGTGFRTTKTIKGRLDKIAKDERRSVSVVIEMLLVEAMDAREHVDKTIRAVMGDK